MKEILKSLHTYAVDPPPGLPPEILPWEHEHPWGLDGAARATLGCLIAGEPPGERLFALADYLLTFCIEGYGPRGFPDAPLLNGTALALCGYLCDGAHPEAEIWRVTGCARLATEVHARRAALDDRMAANCLLAVCRVADALELPLLADLITLRERMWGRLLDHGRAERLHVSEAAYPSYMTAPVAPEQVGPLMANREWQWRVHPREFLPEADMTMADAACDNLITLQAHMFVRHQFGSEIDWHLRLFDDKESTVSLGAQPFIRNLALAYAETGDEKYARHAARLLWSFYSTTALPNHRQLVGPWRTLEVGNRQANMWPVITELAGRTDAFDAATHAMLARSRLEHIRYALAFCGGANNWYQVESAGLACAALTSPELRHADAYLRIALRRLKWLNSFAYYDDGFQFELTPGYHVFPTSSIFSVVQVAKARSVALPEDFVSLVEKAHEMYLFAVQPNHYLPTLNDCGALPVDPAPLLQTAATAFQRDDFRWGGTYGQVGSAPGHTSHAWDAAGYYVMRDKWGEDGQYLFFDGAPWGASHQHEDKLSFVAYAHGRLLIGDPNIYSYSRTELTHYFRSARAHNTVLVDGKGQARKFTQASKLATQGRNEWMTTESFDFVSSEYVEGYAIDPYNVEGRVIELDESLSHRRTIFYIKPGYWILCDLIRGGDEDTHTLEQVFHLAPLYTPDAADVFQAGEVAVSPSAIVTQNAGVANLAILPVDTNGLQVRAQKGETSPAVGWYGVLGEFPAWDVTLEREATLPARLDAVLFPMAPGATAHPTVQRLRADPHVTAFRITGEGIDDTFVLCEEDAGPVTVGDVTFEGRALLIRRLPEMQTLAVEPIRVEILG